MEAREIAGAVTAVATADEVVHQSAVGWADRQRQQPMQVDSIFWIASMSKPITGTAVMMLQERGKLAVDDPVKKHLPEFANLKDANGNSVDVTIRHLLTHTSGLSELTGDQERELTTLEAVAQRVAQKPVRFEPGSRWSYCQSGINTAARIVEVASGRLFPEFLQRELFDPLEMPDTTFYLTKEQLERLAVSYRTTDRGELEPAEIFILAGKPPTHRDRYPRASGGLFSTAPDYVRFCRMILRGGELEGRRYLQRDSIERMSRIYTDELQTGFTPGNGWGLGWCVVRQPQGVTSILSPGSFGHGGAYGTQAWLDPARGAAYILMVQRTNFPNADASDVRRRFQEAASARVGPGR